jgi:hypothetical protein
MPTSPVNNPFFDLMRPAIQARNALADQLFYNVGGLTEAETSADGPDQYRRGDPSRRTLCR